MPDLSILDADRQFALSQVRFEKRPAVGALWRLDAALGAVIAGGREPMISRIRLAWWREALEKLDREKLPAEPLLQDIAAHVLPNGVTGAELAEMERGWAVLLSEESLTAVELDDYAEGRGHVLFRLSTRLLGGEADARFEQAGQGWALADLARRSNRADAGTALAAATAKLEARPHWPAGLRPLGMLAALARRDVKRGLDRLEPPGAPPRLARMLRHRLTGK